jgi:calcium-dependent protein kinase
MGCCQSHSKTLVEESVESEAPQSKRANIGHRKRYKSFRGIESPNVTPNTPFPLPQTAVPQPSVPVTSKLILQIKSELSSNYRVDKLIGEGSRGYVYKAVNRTTGEIRAIKTVDLRKMSVEAQVSLKNQLEVMKTVDHPHIAKVHEVIEEGQKLHIITEFCSGGELLSFLAITKSCTENVTAVWFMQLMSAVKYLHLLHLKLKDLKAENILLDRAKPTGAIRLVNFGAGLSLQKTPETAYPQEESKASSPSEQNDIMSCGVILCLILTGQPPSKVIAGATKQGSVPRASSFKAPSVTSSGHPDQLGKEWSLVSSEARDLCAKMLMKDPHERPTAAEVLEHPWITMRTSQASAELPLASKVLHNLSAFKAKSSLAKAAMAYIHTSMGNEREVVELRKIFMSLDTDKDGQLTLQEIISALYLADTALPINIDAIFAKIDADGNGFISYSEFVIATTNWTMILTEDRLEAAFDAFDKDNDGFISAEEIKDIFKADDPLSQAIVTEVDLNTDGRIDFAEFKAMMLRKRRFA